MVQTPQLPQLPDDWRSWDQDAKEELLHRLLYDFDLWRLPQQEIPPDSQWRYYLNLSGRGGSKMVTLDTKIVTYNQGVKTMGTIEPGDIIFDENGDPTTVIHCSEVQYEPSYTLTFSDNSTLTAHAGHQWVTLTHAERKKYLRKDKSDYNPNQPPIPPNWANKAPVTTQEIIDTFTHSSRKDLNHCIPLTKPLQYPEQDLPLHPYYLGIFLGDGISINGDICSGLDDYEDLLSIFEAFGIYLNKIKILERDIGSLSYLKLEDEHGTFTSRLKGLNILNNKHIPDIYLHSSEKQRRYLLAGLLDSDGHASKDKKRAHFTNTNQILVEQVHHLALSLGYKATVTNHQGVLNGVKKKMAWQVSFPAIDDPFLLPRKSKIIQDQLKSAQQSRNHHRMIKSITPGPVLPMRCIMVDSPNSMYLVGEALIPTHNTRIASEEIRRRALANPNTRINLIAPTHGDCRDTGIEGDSGILAVCAPGEIKKYLKNNGQIIFRNGSRVLTFSAQEPERLRGKQSHYAFLDEFAAFDETAEEILQQVQMSNRLGKDPKIYITTTPKPIEVLQKLMDRPDCHVVVCGTLDNPFLAAPTVRELVERYADTSIGQQELFGQLLKESKDALWSRALIDSLRITKDKMPRLKRIVVAVDPARTNTKRSDEAGIIVGGVGEDNHYYITHDYSCKASPQDWAKLVVRAYHVHKAALVVVEKSDGDLVKTILKNIEPTLPIRMLQHQRKGKITRAEPAAALYEQGLVHHVGMFATLEDQLTGKVQGDNLPDDRYDALVYLLKELASIGAGGTFVPARSQSLQARSRRSRPF